MFKKFISYLIIISILFIDGASCMRRGSRSEPEDERPLRHRRSRSADDYQVTFQPSLPRVRSEELLRLQGDDAEARDVQALQLPILPSPLLLLDEEEEPFPAQENPGPPSPSQGDREEAGSLGSPLVVESDEEGEEDKAEDEEDEIEAIQDASLSLDEEDEEGFFIIPEGHGSQVSLYQVEGDALAEDSLIQKTSSLQFLEIISQQLTFEEREALDAVLRIEGTWKNNFVWANSNLEILIHKSLFALTTNKSAVNKRKQKACCDPLWLHGGPLPLEDDAAIKRNVILKSFGNSLEEGVIESLHTTLLALLGYQVYKLIQSGKWVMDFASLASFYFVGSDKVSYLGTIRTLHEYPALFAILGVPLVFATLKTLYSYLQISEPTDEAVSEDIESLTNRSRKWDWPIFNLLSLIPVVSTLLNFHPLKRKIPGLTSLILWEGRLPSETRDNAFNALLELARNRTGFSRMTALESLARLAHGINIRNLALRPHDVEGLLHIKLRAFHALKEIYKEIPTCSLNKFGTGALLWEMGQSPSYFISLAEPVIKAFRAALYVYMIYGIYDVLYKYFTCPFEYLENFSWLNGGLEPYASDYSKECFDAQVAVFNTLPGQPASTLVGDLGRYHFTEPYDLDLSNKGIQGPIIAYIVEGFKKANVPLRSLNVSYNVITNSSDVARILEALPSGIMHLDLSNVNGDYAFSSYSPRVFIGLGRLTGLQSFNISDNVLHPDNMGAIGMALQNLSHLKELRLGGNDYDGYPDTNITLIAQSLKPSLTLLDLTGLSLREDLKGQIALGNSLAKISTLEQLYLGNTIGGTTQTNRTLNEAAIVALANGLSSQQKLRILDLSYNWLGYWDGLNNNKSILLSSLPPSLTHLDVSQNDIGYYPQEVTALAQSVQKMSGLSSFRAGNDCGSECTSNELGTFPAFLGSLQGKQNLTFLDLSWNLLSNTTMMRELLQTTPNLETLDLSNNQLTHGTLLAPILSTLGKLQSLNLGDNQFTTADRVSIWKATSFLTKLPFYLDEDLNFASTYLKSFNSTTTSLDLSGLIQNNPTAFEIIMPQVIDLFPNLRELDLSNNYIFGVDDNHKPILGGIQALITYLPHLPHLQSLRISNALKYFDKRIILPELKTFSQIIGQLTNLRTLDFSNTEFLLADSLGKGLENIHSLTSITLANCWPYDWQGGVQLIQGLQMQPNLNHLDLSSNQIGFSFSNNSNHKDPNSTLALAKAFHSWPHLQSLNLAVNDIGVEDPASASTFLEKLADLAEIVNKQGRTLEVDLVNGINIVEWNPVAGVLQALTQQKIKDACALQLCTGEPISKPTPSETQAHGFQREWGRDPATSDGSRPAPFWFVTSRYSPARLWGALKGFWSQGPEQALDLTNPHVRKLVELRDRCGDLKNAADESYDRWYGYSLEDLAERVTESLKKPEAVCAETVVAFEGCLKEIKTDFRPRTAHRAKPTFFTGLASSVPHFSQERPFELLSIPLTPTLGGAAAPLALGY